MNIKNTQKIYKSMSIRSVLFVLFVAGLFLMIVLPMLRAKRSDSVVSDSLRSLERCDSSPNPKNCYEQHLHTLSNSGAIDGAFEALAALYDRGELSGDTCHDLTHQIGQSAYTLYARGKRFSVSPKTAYCSYGFYHGFMELLVAKGGDMKKARDFCEYVDKQLAQQTPDVALQCYHGIGHGTVNSHDPRQWGNEQVLIEPALELCEQVADTPERLSRCATGVFNGIATFYATGQYKLAVRPHDPLWVCRAQIEKYKDACYISLNITLLSLAQGDLRSAARFVEVIPEDAYAQHAMINLAAPIGTRNAEKTDYSDVIATCRSLQPRLRASCFQGYAFGFMEHGQPEQEYKKAFAFCGSKLLDVNEQRSCFEYIFSYLRQWYSKDKSYAICKEETSDLRQLCLDNISVEVPR